VRVPDAGYLNPESEIRKNPLTNQRDGGEVGGKIQRVGDQFTLF
jgi:hypothetical protein